MRIGIDARLWNETGVGRYIRNLVFQLQELDKTNEYVLFVQKGIKNPFGKLRTGQELGIKENWKVVETDIRWHSLKEQIAFPQVLYKEKLDLMHFPYFSVPILYNRPYVLTIHDLIINHFPTGKASTLPFPLYQLKHAGYKFIIQHAAKSAQKIFAVSEATKDEIVDHLKIAPEKIVVTHEGVEESEKLETKNSKQQHEQMHDYFLYVGNAYPHKNLERLLEAFRKVATQHKDLKLILVGKEDYFYKRLKQKIQESGLENHVGMTGFVSDEELHMFYHHAIATVVPSLMEGFGLPALEAMAASCPVLASNIPSLQEVCGDAAIYADPFDPADLAEKMKDLLTDKKLRSELIKKGAEQVKKFSWKRLARQTLAVYNTV